MSRIIIVSNRLPVKISKSGDDISFQPSEGGLASGLGTIYNKDGGNIWIGWPGMNIENNQQRKEVDRKLAELNLYPVYLNPEEINQYYEGFSNEILWPVFHYMVAYAHYENSYWECYYRVNKKFCAALLQRLQPGDIVWVHDYHLLLLPGMIRAAQPNTIIGFFQHIPFPSFELFRLIPWRAELLEGMLGADLLGFHTFDDARHFLNACSRILNVQSSFNTVTYKDKNITVESFPMGIDYEKFLSLSHDPVVMQNMEQFKKTFGDVRLILSIDRLDYSKGIIQRLQSFNGFLEKYPEYREKVSIYMIVVPSRDNVPLYKELRDEIDKLVGNINARFRTNNWSPVNYFYRSFPIEMLAALYQSVDVCLVTPMRDGMNLVCKEFVASRIDNNGVLILSEMAGAAKELVDAIIVNPNNIEEMSNAMLKALNMPLYDQEIRMKQMRQLVSKYNVHNWSQTFVKRLQEVIKKQVLLSKYIDVSVKRDIRLQYANAKSRLLFLDYDGTLVNFSTQYLKASPDKELYTILNALTSDPRNRVVIISGRNYVTLEEWLGRMKLDLIGEHGTWQKKYENNKWEKTVKLTDAWKLELLPILHTYTDRTPGSFIEEKSYSLVWHYRKVENDLGELRASELSSNLRYFLSDMPLNLLAGNKIIEIKSMEVNKGKIVESYLNDTVGFDFVMAIGDDITDEDMFKVLKGKGETIKIGNGKSAASYYLNSVKEARAFLSSLPAKKWSISRIFNRFNKLIPKSFRGLKKTQL
jgi:trehalose 6-phosphate synthase/phosphatase